MASLAADFIDAVTGKVELAGPSTRRQVELHIADAFGIAIAAGNGSSLGQTVAGEMAANDHGSGRIIGAGRSVSPQSAAFANAALIHVLDFDDIHDEARLHPTCVTLPAALAAADLASTAGRKLVQGVLLGSEAMCRLGVAVCPQGSGGPSNWFLTQLFGYVGGALSAGYVMGLTHEQLVSAVGLAYMQAAGGKEAGFGVGGNARGIYPAFAAAGGMQAALLARAGVVGPASALDGSANLFAIYFGEELSPVARGKLVGAEGWSFVDTEIKPWPSCRLSQPYVAESLEIRSRVDVGTVSDVIVGVNESAKKLCEPLGLRAAPQTLADAKYSIPFMVAVALVHGRVDLAGMREPILTDQRVLEIARRVRVEPGLPDGPGHPPAKISVVHNDGGLVASSQRGIPQLGASGIRGKFADCLAASGCAASAVTRLWDRCMQLESSSVADLWADVPA